MKLERRLRLVPQTKRRRNASLPRAGVNPGPKVEHPGPKVDHPGPKVDQEAAAVVNLSAELLQGLDYDVNNDRIVFVRHAVRFRSSSVRKNQPPGSTFVP